MSPTIAGTSWTELDVSLCKLTALPANIGKLSRLRSLKAWRNLFKELPRSIVELDASCYLDAEDSRLRTPPLTTADLGISAIKRYVEELEDTA